MTRDDLINEYFDWMCDYIYDKRSKKKCPYRKLLSYLYSTEFTYTLEMDENRAADGADLRYKFGNEVGQSKVTIARYLDDKPCSILEMMLALSINCEVHIMSDTELGNRTSKWFWYMVENLGLITMRDSRFDRDYVTKVIFIFLNRRYKRNGDGGLFTVNDPSKDMRDIDIWYQMCAYLNPIIGRTID